MLDSCYFFRSPCQNVVWDEHQLTFSLLRLKVSIFSLSEKYSISIKIIHTSIWHGFSLDTTLMLLSLKRLPWILIGSTHHFSSQKLSGKERLGRELKLIFWLQSILIDLGAASQVWKRCRGDPQYYEQPFHSQARENSEKSITMIHCRVSFSEIPQTLTVKDNSIVKIFHNLKVPHLTGKISFSLWHLTLAFCRRCWSNNFFFIISESDWLQSLWFRLFGSVVTDYLMCMYVKTFPCNAFSVT